MENLKLSFILLALFGFVCAGNADTFPSLTLKSNDSTTAEDKPAVSGGSAAESPVEDAATTSEPESSCGGLKGFLHICDKSEPSEKVQKRSASDDDSSDSSDSDESDESPAEKSSATTEKGVAKRQAEDLETPDSPEEPPMVDSALPQPDDAPEDAMEVKKRQTEDSSSSEETEEERRRR